MRWRSEHRQHPYAIQPLKLVGEWCRGTAHEVGDDNVTAIAEHDGTKCVVGVQA